MKLAINALAMRSLGHGVGNYIANLSLTLATQHKDDQFTFFINPSNKDLPDYLSGLRNVRFEVIRLPRPMRIIWEQIVLPFKVRNFDILHSPVYVAPILKLTRYILTELDMSVFVEPNKYTFAKRIYFQTMIPLSCKRVDKILAISNSAANELTRVLNVPKEKVVTTPLGVRANLKRVTERKYLDIVKSKYSLPDKFILFLGVLEPRKNVASLVSAFAEISHIDLDLVIAGSRGFDWESDEVYRLVKEKNLESRVHFVGTIEEEDKAALYSMATLFAYPSFYEGFGIPVLEAMACGTPVITSRGSSLEEIAGDAAELVDPHNINEISSTILKVSGDTVLQEKMSKRGRNNVRKFSWSKTAKLTYETYKNY